MHNYKSTEYISFLQKGFDNEYKHYILRWKNSINAIDDVPRILTFPTIEDILEYININYNRPFVYNTNIKRYTNANSIINFDDTEMKIIITYYKKDGHSHQLYDAELYLKIKNALIEKSANKFTKGDFILDKE
jgi:hypothetical protein